MCTYWQPAKAGDADALYGFTLCSTTWNSPPGTTPTLTEKTSNFENWEPQGDGHSTGDGASMASCCSPSMAKPPLLRKMKLTMRPATEVTTKNIKMHLKIRAQKSVAEGAPSNWRRSTIQLSQKVLTSASAFAFASAAFAEP